MLKFKQKSWVVYFSRTKDKINCEPCQSGKIVRSPFLASSSHATARLELIHADLCGPIEETSFSGAKYLLLLEDDYSRKQFGYFLKAKSDVCKYTVCPQSPLGFFKNCGAQTKLHAVCGRLQRDSGSFFYADR
jgi:hypothetical protein